MVALVVYSNRQRALFNCNRTVLENYGIVFRARILVSVLVITYLHAVNLVHENGVPADRFARRVCGRKNELRNFGKPVGNARAVACYESAHRVRELPAAHELRVARIIANPVAVNYLPVARRNGDGILIHAEVNGLLGGKVVVARGEPHRQSVVARA